MIDIIGAFEENKSPFGGGRGKGDRGRRNMLDIISALGEKIDFSPMHF